MLNMLNLRLTNTLTNKKEVFKSIESNKVKMYVCGVTPYDYSHLGHGRVYVIFDLLYRLLKFLKYDVIYVRNFTDVDDKLIFRAKNELGDASLYQVVANKYIAAFGLDMEKLNCLTPDFEPRVTQTIPEIISFVQGIIDCGKAYIINGDIYFDINSFDVYGKLSKRKKEDEVVGARVDVRLEKRNPLDFALWKKSKDNIGFESPWGLGRPGWHIECSAMAKKLLGVQIDIHAGGMDLIFPHHENEIAQSEGLHNKEFAKYWLHNAFININQEKMSKSLGNFFTLIDTFKKVDPMVLRYYYITHHYRNPIDFSFDAVQAAQKGYKRLISVFEHIEAKGFDSSNSNALLEKILDYILDDLNISGAMGIIFDNLKIIQEDLTLASEIKFILQTIFGLKLTPIIAEKFVITDEIKKLIEDREAARLAKNWALADRLRQKLIDLGFEVQDIKS